VKFSLYLKIIIKKLNFLNRFSQNTQISNLMKIHPVGTELFHADRRTDGETDGRDESNGSFSQIL